MFTIDEARRVAQDWHGGQSSAFYAFASTGHIDGPGLASEARMAVKGAQSDALTDEDREAARDLLQLCEALETIETAMDDLREAAQAVADADDAVERSLLVDGSQFSPSWRAIDGLEAVFQLDEHGELSEQVDALLDDLADDAVNWSVEWEEGCLFVLVQLSLRELAGVAAGYFVRVAREDGSGHYTATRDDAPEWVGEMVRDAHEDMLPGDYRYRAVEGALEAIRDADDDADLEDVLREWAGEAVDDSYRGLLRWLDSYAGHRFGYCDEARESGLVADDAGIVARLQAGQRVELEAVGASVLASLREQAGEA
jgi:hypothetical protein